MSSYTDEELAAIANHEADGEAASLAEELLEARANVKLLRETVLKLVRPGRSTWPR